jgi:hypothetical protein
MGTDPTSSRWPPWGVMPRVPPCPFAACRTPLNEEPAYGPRALPACRYGLRQDGDGRLARCSAPGRVRSIADSDSVGGTHSTGCRVRFCMLCSRSRRPPCLLLGRRPERNLGDTPSQPRKPDRYPELPLQSLKWSARLPRSQPLRHHMGERRTQTPQDRSGRFFTYATDGCPRWGEGHCTVAGERSTVSPDVGDAHFTRRHLICELQSGTRSR